MDIESNPCLVLGSGRLAGLSQLNQKPGRGPASQAVEENSVRIAVWSETWRCECKPAITSNVLCMSRVFTWTTFPAQFPSVGTFLWTLKKHIHYSPHWWNRLPICTPVSLTYSRSQWDLYTLCFFTFSSLAMWHLEQEGGLGTARPVVSEIGSPLHRAWRPQRQEAPAHPESPTPQVTKAAAPWCLHAAYSAPGFLGVHFSLPRYFTTKVFSSFVHQCMGHADPWGTYTCWGTWYMWFASLVFTYFVWNNGLLIVKCLYHWLTLLLL
jgi:hypothetical protein